MFLDLNGIPVIFAQANHESHGAEPAENHVSAAIFVFKQTAEAKEVMDRAHSALNGLGLLSEDYETSNMRMWGNFPQAYSHVGLIHAAFAASPSWADVL